MSEPGHREATYEDLLALPDTMIGQIVRGVLHAMPRPAPKHALAASRLSEELGPPFRRGRNGTEGWIILFEPELHLWRNVLVPDLAGWRRERMPELPAAQAYFELSPDWICEILSPSTAALDRGEKLKIYAEHAVRHVWFVDPEGKVLEILELDGKSYRVRDVFSGDAKVRAVPFDAIELDLGVLWAL